MYKINVNYSSNQCSHIVQFYFHRNMQIRGIIMLLLGNPSHGHVKNRFTAPERVTVKC